MWKSRRQFLYPIFNLNSAATNVKNGTEIIKKISSQKFKKQKIKKKVKNIIWDLG